MSTDKALEDFNPKAVVIDPPPPDSSHRARSPRDRARGAEQEIWQESPSGIDHDYTTSFVYRRNWGFSRGP